MKICSKCFGEFNEREDTGNNPVVELGDIFFEFTTEDNSDDLCPQCREELGMLNLVGFEK